MERNRSVILTLLTLTSYVIVGVQWAQASVSTSSCTSGAGEFLTGSSGFFSSPNFPNNYPQNSSCTWNITVPSGYIIKVSFLHFQLGSSFPNRDLVIITNLASSGHILHGQSLPDPVYSAGNSIQVIFTSHTNHYSGFNASYTAITFESLCPHLMTLNETSVVITSPFYPRDYPDNLTCSWKVTASKGYRVRLFIEYMDIQSCGASCTCDYLEIQNGSFSGADAPSGRMCGGLRDHHVVYDSFNDSLGLLFVSDGSADWYRKSGFKAIYTAQVNYTGLPVACSSGEFLTGSSGLFSSPNFPNNYPQYSRCFWNITVPSRYIIKVSFLHFELGSSSYRYHDCVTITNIASSGDVLYGWSVPDPVYSVGNSIQVIFTSLTNQYSGFNASYTAITFESLCPNMMTLNETSGVITSPFYPRYYPGNQACNWKVTTSKGYRVRLLIDFMDIQSCGAFCTCDYLEIQNGSFSGAGAPNGRMCGSFRRYVFYYSFDESLEVRFVSDGSANYYRGFKATYTAQVNYTGLPVACYSGEFLTGSRGFFSSPNFPNNYPRYRTCNWNIIVPSGYIIKVSFLHFELGPYSDRVSITNLASSGHILYGQSFPDPVYSVGNSIQVTFTSLTNQYSGFNASYTTITFESLCPNMMTLNETSGVITSPFYPRDHPGNMTCSWKITASKGKRVKLVIEDMRIHRWCGRETCTCVYLEIQNGSFSSDGVPGGRMCGELIGSVTFYSFHETLEVLFVSDWSWYRGFRANYTQQNYTVSTECSNYRFLNESDRARTYSGITYICDANLTGWYRFSGEAGSQMAESCVDWRHCGTDAPGWLNRSHPAVADGVVQRNVCFNHANNCCNFSTYISVRNCGEFYVYKLDGPNQCNLRYCGNGLPLAPECSNYSFLNESDRARTSDVVLHQGDDTLSVGWYRFSGAAGNQMAESYVDRYHCGVHFPGWLNGSHPTVADGAVQRRVCFSYYYYHCIWSTYISVRNCGGFYVYKLRPVSSNHRYCGNGFAPTTRVTPAPTSSGYVITPSVSLSAPTSSGYVITSSGSPSAPTSSGHVITPSGSPSAPTSSGNVITSSGSPSAMTSTPTAEITQPATQPPTPTTEITIKSTTRRSVDLRITTTESLSSVHE